MRWEQGSCKYNLLNFFNYKTNNFSTTVSILEKVGVESIRSHYLKLEVLYMTLLTCMLIGSRGIKEHVIPS